MYYLEGHHEPIVSREQFERAQEIMKSGRLKEDWTHERPESYKSVAWQLKNGRRETNNNAEIFARLRGCCTKRGKGAIKDGEKCLYGRCKCYGCTESED